MVHKRYKNPRNGYSRAQERSRLAAVIDEELEQARTPQDLGDGMAALLNSANDAGAAELAAEPAVRHAAAQPPEGPSVQLAETTAAPRSHGRPAAKPACEAPPEDTRRRIRAVDRLLGLLRRGR